MNQKKTTLKIAHTMICLILVVGLLTVYTFASDATGSQRQMSKVFRSRSFVSVVIDRFVFFVPSLFFCKNNTTKRRL